MTWFTFKINSCLRYPWELLCPVSVVSPPSVVSSCHNSWVPFVQRGPHLLSCHTDLWKKLGKLPCDQRFLMWKFSEIVFDFLNHLSHFLGAVGSTRGTGRREGRSQCCHWGEKILLSARTCWFSFVSGLWEVVSQTVKLWIHQALPLFLTVLTRPVMSINLRRRLVVTQTSLLNFVEAVCFHTDSVCARRYVALRSTAKSSGIESYLVPGLVRCSER